MDDLLGDFAYPLVPLSLGWSSGGDASDCYTRTCDDDAVHDRPKGTSESEVLNAEEDEDEK